MVQRQRAHTAQVTALEGELAALASANQQLRFQVSSACSHTAS